MTCHRCGRIVPDEFLTCPACTLAAADEAMRLYQLDALTRLESTGARFALRTVERVRHVQLLGYPQSSFCGLPLPSRARFSTFDWMTENATKLCPSCRSKIVEILGHDFFIRDAAQASAS